MLKRQGELCQHEVPGYPGLLTNREYRAYRETVSMVEWELQLYNKKAAAFSEIEKQISRLRKLADNATPENAQVITVRGDEKTWRVLEIFFAEKNESELLFCLHDSKSGRLFSVIHNFRPESAMKKLLGSSFLAVGRNPSGVLEHFLNNELYALDVARKRVELAVAEDLLGRLPGPECRRVFNAIIPLYDKQKSVENENSPSEKIATGMRMKL